MQVCTLLQTDKHASTPPLSFLQAGCPSCRPTNRVKALKALFRREIFGILLNLLEISQTLSLLDTVNEVIFLAVIGR